MARMNEVDLTLLGKQVADLQSEMRAIRAGQTALAAETRTDSAALRAYVAAHLSGVQTALETYFDRRLDTVERRLDELEAIIRKALAK